MSLFKTNEHMFLFTRRKKRLCVITSFIVALVFVLYQFLLHYIVSNNQTANKSQSSTLEPKLVRGTHIKEKAFYTPNNGQFNCFKSGEIIDFAKVNDNYCDCADSTDEPGTNACPDGIFYCSNISKNSKYPKMVTSSKVNDGICDCCDGSDEHGNADFSKSPSGSLQPKMKSSSCSNMC